VKTILPFIISGIATGSIYGLAGTGLVLTYKTSGIFNFAHGAMATFAAYLYYLLNHDHGLAWPLAVAISVVVAGPVMGFVMEPAARRLQSRFAVRSHRRHWSFASAFGLRASDRTSDPV